MCDLCESDKVLREKAIKDHQARADQLRALAHDYEMLARGIVKPHTEAAKGIGARASSVVRFLVEDWV